MVKAKRCMVFLLQHFEGTELLGILRESCEGVEGRMFVRLIPLVDIVR